jgi:hypothetical protein
VTGLDNRPACNYHGDVSGMVGQIVGPTLAGELLVADAVTYDPGADRSRVLFRYATDTDVAAWRALAAR